MVGEEEWAVVVDGAGTRVAGPLGMVGATREHAGGGLAMPGGRRLGDVAR